jgi:hypothetical protein
MTDEEVAAFVRGHCSGVENAVELADVYDAERLKRLLDEGMASGPATPIAPADRSESDDLANGKSN